MIPEPDEPHGEIKNSWTNVSSNCDPVGDIRVYAFSILVCRPPTLFESMLARAGLAYLLDSRIPVPDEEPPAPPPSPLEPGI